MIKKLVAIVTIILCMSVLSSCRGDEVFENPYEEYKMVMSTSDWRWSDTMSRTVLFPEKDVVVSKWAAGDRVSVYLQDGREIPVVLTDSVERRKATVPKDSSMTDLSDFHSACYPPMDRMSGANLRLKISFEGQTQKGKSSLAHLSHYDIQVAKAYERESTTFFDFEHLGCLIALDITLKQAGEVNHVVLQSDRNLFVTEGTVDMKADRPFIHAVTKSSQMRLELCNHPLVATNGTFRAYLMLAPADFTGSQVKVWVNGCVGVVSMGKLEAGKAYRLQAVLNKPIYPPEPWVDLGLKVFWSDRNLGATAPENMGTFYAWGEPFTKETFFREDCPTYGRSGEWDEGIAGIVSYDPAAALSGEEARMPTLEEMDELIEHCSWKWTSIHGVNGAVVFGPNGNSIFIPAVGYREGVSVFDEGERCCCWSASPFYGDNFFAHYLSIGEDEMTVRWDYRHIGLTVRPVREK